MKKTACILAAFAFLCLQAAAQTGLTAITADNGISVGGKPIAAGKVLLTPVDTTGKPIAFVSGAGGGLNAPNAFPCNIAGGVLTGCYVPNACLTTPDHILYTIDVTATASYVTFRLPMVANICGPTWALDTYAPPSVTTNAQPLQITYDTSPAPNPCATGFHYQLPSGPLTVCVAGVPVPVGGGGGLADPGGDGLVKRTALNVTSPATPGTDYVLPGGNVATATALAGVPTMCSAGQAPTGINASGNAIGCTTIPVPYSGVNTFGDSITNGAGSTTFMQGGGGAKGYAWQLINAFGGKGTNYGYGSDMAGDLVLKVQSNLSPRPSGNLLTAIMDSTNDADVYGDDDNLKPIFAAALSNAMVWSAIPDKGKLLMSTDGTTVNSACNLAGWQVFNNLGTGYQPFIYSHTQNDIATCTLTTYQSGPIYISYLIENQSVWATASNFSVTVDGGAAVNFAPAPSASSITTANGVTAFPILGRIPGPFAAGTHTVVMKNTAATGGVPATAAVVFWLGAPVPAGASTNPPDVFVGGTPWNQNDNDSVTTAAYNPLIQSTITGLNSDGLTNVHFVPIRSFLNSTIDYSGGALANGIVCPASAFLPLHPNDCGHDHLAQAFLASMPASNFSGPLPLLTYFGPVRSLSGGNGWVFGAPSAWQVGTSIGVTKTCTALPTVVGGIITGC